jgi:F0F1-type ATP synthase assembly protein I
LRTERSPDPSRLAPDEERAEARAALGTYVTVGLALGVVMLVFTGIGYWLDGRLGTLPLLTVAGALLGCAGGFLHLVRTLTAARTRPSGGAPPGRTQPPAG